MPLSKHFRFCLWWESFFNGGHFSTCQTRKKSTPVTFFLHMRHVFLRPGVISLRRKMTPRSIFDGGRYSSLHRRGRTDEPWSNVLGGTGSLSSSPLIVSRDSCIPWTCARFQMSGAWPTLRVSMEVFYIHVLFLLPYEPRHAKRALSVAVT